MLKIETHSHRFFSKKYPSFYEITRSTMISKPCMLSTTLNQLACEGRQCSFFSAYFLVNCFTYDRMSPDKNWGNQLLAVKILIGLVCLKIGNWRNQIFESFSLKLKLETVHNSTVKTLKRKTDRQFLPLSLRDLHDNWLTLLAVIVVQKEDGRIAKWSSLKIPCFLQSTTYYQQLNFEVQ